MENKFKWLYIGSGNICSQTAKSIEKGNHLITAVYSRNFEKAKDFAKKHNAIAYETFDDAISADFDAVYIGTPHTSHLEYTIKSLNNKKPVLCEKSLGVSSKEVEKMISASKDNNTYLCEAMWTWFSDVALEVKKWIDNDEIGKVTDMYISFCIPGMFMDKKSRVFNPNTAGGALLDITVYPITYCYNLFGYPDEIICKGKVKNGIDVSDKITLKYGDLSCHIKSNFSYLEEKCIIKGTEGKISVPMFHIGRIAKLTNKYGSKTFNGKTDYLTEFSRVSDEIKNGNIESDYVPLKHTLDCMKIMDECRKQMNLVYPFER